MPVSTLQHGITDVCLSMPVAGGGGVVRGMEVPIAGEGQRRLTTSADTIRDTIRFVGF